MQGQLQKLLANNTNLNLKEQMIKKKKKFNLTLNKNDSVFLRMLRKENNAETVQLSVKLRKYRSS